ncbi:Aminotransferase [Trypanosoma melophagium]|uniref:Aminotransferase n=1 Tax=Trypanosoma melophagium TaxID=715481 RepID=UPI003519FD50|nr:Aminotransferase [Trypanosoma melophagium]
MRPFLAAGLSGRAILGSYRSAGSYFDCVPKGAPDSILGLSLEFQHDPHPNKVNLAVGVYRDDNNRPFVLESVKKADTSGDMEYAPINGVPSFLKVAQKLCFGDDCSAIRDGRIASCQTLGGTGALRISGEVLHRFVDNCSTIHSQPGLREPRWEELNMMSGRLRSVRQRLVKELKECGSTLDWSHVVRQIGMMAYTGLTKEQVELLKKKHHVYMTLNGRAAISGLNSTNVVYVAKAFHDVTK